MKAGALDCIQSPITVDVLKAKMRWFLDAKYYRKIMVDFVKLEEHFTSPEFSEVIEENTVSN